MRCADIYRIYFSLILFISDKERAARDYCIIIFGELFIISRVTKQTCFKFAKPYRINRGLLYYGKLLAECVVQLIRKKLIKRLSGLGKFSNLPYTHMYGYIYTYILKMLDYKNSSL